MLIMCMVGLDNCKGIGAGLICIILSVYLTFPHCGQRRTLIPENFQITQKSVPSYVSFIGLFASNS